MGSGQVKLSQGSLLALVGGGLGGWRQPNLLVLPSSVQGLDVEPGKITQTLGIDACCEGAEAGMKPTC